MPVVLSEKRPIARKPYKCDSCGRQIDAGNKYYRQVYADGGLRQFISHDACDTAARIVAHYLPSYCLEDGYPRVSEFDLEDIELVREEAPNVATSIWGSVRNDP